MTEPSAPGELPLQPLTEAVVASFAETPDERLREVLGATVRHLHDLIRELRLTTAEWEGAVDFLTRVGQHCDATRQEVVLLSDVLGVSTLVASLEEAEHPEATATTVLGPFHLTASPERTLGDTIDLVGGAEPCVLDGVVETAEGEPVAGASVDVWQCNALGFYDVQQPDAQPAGNGRGLFRTDDLGRFWLRTVVPSHYPIPTDGPVGELLHASRRHPWRPAHVHLMVHAPGHRSLTTHVFVAGSPYLDSDAVFAVRPSLVEDFRPAADGSGAREASVRIVLAPLPGRPLTDG